VLRLAANRLTERGQRDLEALKIEFEELIVLDAPIEITGFSPAETDHVILGDAADSLEQGPLEPDSVTAAARVGDDFQLGPHRIVCGDATDPAVLAHLLEGDPAARLVLIDEPYNVRIAGNVTGGADREFAMASGEMSDAEFLAFNGPGWRPSCPIFATTPCWVHSSTGAACRLFTRPRRNSASFP
jgi:hypothetical protein